MMETILTAGINQSLLKHLEKEDTFFFEPVYNEENSVNPAVHKAVAVLANTAAIRPVILAQIIQKADPNVSIIFLAERNKIYGIKQQILFAPFVSRNFEIIDENDIPLIVSLLKDAIDKTNTRRDFSHLQKSATRVNTSFRIPERISRQYQEKFIDQSPLGAVLINQDGDILSMNRQASLILGNEKENFHHSKFHDLFNKEQKKRIIELLKGGKQERLTVEYKNAHEKYLELIVSAIEENQRSNFRLIIVNDVSEKIIAQKALTLKIRDLERANEELEHFAYIISHDLKNPITSIQQLSKNILEEEDENEIKTMIEMIGISANHVIQLYNGLEVLLDVNRLIEIQTREITFVNILEFVLAELNHSLKAKNGEIKSDFTKAPGIRYIEPYLISIFSNLIRNAIKYSSPERALEISVNTRVKDDFVVLTVEDNGTGIDLERYREKLFRPFHRLTENASGKGIGLSLIKRMIEKNGGEIQVESTPGIGTKFICFLKPYSE